jgi:hypothetical protein
MIEHARFNEADGMAALGICESLLIALTELKVICEQDARDLLTDVATAHSEAADTSKRLRDIGLLRRLCGASSPARTACGIRHTQAGALGQPGSLTQVSAPLYA